MINNAFEGIPPSMSYQDGLKYGLKQLDWNKEDLDYLESLAIYVLWHQYKLNLEENTS
jgi:hypothetical protein